MNKKKTTKYERIVINSLDEIPGSFESEDAEREYWATHEYSDEVWQSLEDVTDELDGFVQAAQRRDKRQSKAPAKT
jgi:hypothetical protein